MEKTWFMAPMDYSPNGKGIMVPMDYNPMVYNPNEKDKVYYERLFFEVVMIMVKKKKYNIKDRNLFYTLLEVGKGNVASSF